MFGHNERRYQNDVMLIAVHAFYEVKPTLLRKIKWKQKRGRPCLLPHGYVLA